MKKSAERLKLFSRHQLHPNLQICVKTVMNLNIYSNWTVWTHCDVLSLVIKT